MVRFKTVAQFCAESGYTDNAVRGKIKNGIWLERREYRKAPDGHVLIDVEGYNEWVINGSGKGSELNLHLLSASTSSTKASGAKKPSSSPPPLGT